MGLIKANGNLQVCKKCNYIPLLIVDDKGTKDNEFKSISKKVLNKPKMKLSRSVKYNKYDVGSFSSTDPAKFKEHYDIHIDSILQEQTTEPLMITEPDYCDLYDCEPPNKVKCREDLKSVHILNLCQPKIELPQEIEYNQCSLCSYGSSDNAKYKEHLKTQHMRNPKMDWVEMYIIPDLSMSASQFVDVEERENNNEIKLTVDQN